MGKTAKYIATGLTEVTGMLGFYRKENKRLEKEFKKGTKEFKDMLQVVEDNKKRTDSFVRELSRQTDEAQKDAALSRETVGLLLETIQRASNGLGRKAENPENLTPKDVKAILDKVLDDWEETKQKEEERQQKETVTRGSGCCGGVFGMR